MIQNDRRPVPDPDKCPEAFKDPEVLEDLYVDRGWRRKDICDHFDVPGHKIVDLLQEYDIERETKYSSAPTNGLAKKLWEKGKAEAVK